MSTSDSTTPKEINKMRSLIIITTIVYICFVLTGSCSSKKCATKFYNAFVEINKKHRVLNTNLSDDLKIKEHIFSKLCFPNITKKIIVVEEKRATENVYYQGLIFNYADSTIYYYTLKDGKIFTGKGINGNYVLKNVLDKIKTDFRNGSILLKDENKNLQLFDAPILGLSSINFESDEFENYEFSFAPVKLK